MDPYEYFELQSGKILVSFDDGARTIVVKNNLFDEWSKHESDLLYDFQFHQENYKENNHFITIWEYKKELTKWLTSATRFMQQFGDTTTRIKRCMNEATDIIDEIQTEMPE